MTARPVNLLVFREGRRDVRVRDLKAHLVDQLRRSGTQASPEQTLRLLLLAGELECGVADVIACLDPQSDSLGLSSLTLVSGLKTITDTLATALVGGSPDFSGIVRDSAISGSCADRSRAHLSRAHQYLCSRGFRLLCFASSCLCRYCGKLPGLSSTVAVIGIRSIGTTLSAVVAAAVRRQGKNAGRITVRPHGHPYNRELRFSDAELEFVHSSSSLTSRLSGRG